MRKLSQQDEKELITFIKDWLKVHGYTQRDLAYELNIRSSRTSEIIIKIKDIYKKGGVFNIAKNLIEIEQKWVNNFQTNQQQLNVAQPYNQLDLDSLVNQMNKDSDEKNI